MPSKKIKDFLDQSNIKYVTITHSLAYTAQEIAASAHIKGKGFALPASYKIDFDKLKAGLGNTDVRLANEQEFKDKFPGCEVGAMPPFGNLYDMETYIAASLVEDEEFAFNAGTHTEVIRMDYNDYERLVNPKIIRFATKYKT